MEAIEYTPTTDAADTVKLEHLGPIVVNSNGTMSRIPNWLELGREEQERIARVIAKRNNARLAQLKLIEESEVPRE